MSSVSSLSSLTSDWYLYLQQTKNTTSTQESGTTKTDPMQSAFTALSSALESGDLESAKTAYQQIKEMHENMPAPPDGGNSEADAYFEAIGEALETGDVESAQSAYESFQGAMQGPQGAPPPPPPQSSSDENFKKIQEAFNELSTALESGDLESARTAYSTIQTLTTEMKESMGVTANGTSTGTADTSTSTTKTSAMESLIESLGESLNADDAESSNAIYDQILKEMLSARQKLAARTGSDGLGGLVDRSA